MQQQVLSPSVQNADHANLGAEVLGISRELQRSRGAGREQKIVKHAGVC
jgi:hypothetical protein